MTFTNSNAQFTFLCFSYSWKAASAGTEHLG